MYSTSYFSSFINATVRLLKVEHRAVGLQTGKWVTVERCDREGTSLGKGVVSFDAGWLDTLIVPPRRIDYPIDFDDDIPF